jgi:hypothetical protein
LVAGVSGARVAVIAGVAAGAAVGNRTVGYAGGVAAYQSSPAGRVVREGSEDTPCLWVARVGRTGVVVIANYRCAARALPGLASGARGAFVTVVARLALVGILTSLAVRIKRLADRANLSRSAVRSNHNGDCTGEAASQGS